MFCCTGSHWTAHISQAIHPEKLLTHACLSKDQCESLSEKQTFLSSYDSMRGRSNIPMKRVLVTYWKPLQQLIQRLYPRPFGWNVVTALTEPSFCWKVLSHGSRCKPSCFITNTGDLFYSTTGNSCEALKRPKDFRVVFLFSSLTRAELWWTKGVFRLSRRLLTGLIVAS